MTIMDRPFIDIGAIADIPVRGARVIRAATTCIAIFRTATDAAYALEDRCPHKGGPLSQGIVHGTSVTCPLHNWVINLETGKAEGADLGHVRTIPLRIEDGRILIDVTALSRLSTG